MVKAYCVKCKKKNIEMKNPKLVKKNDRASVKGECIKCGTKMCKFVAKDFKL